MQRFIFVILFVIVLLVPLALAPSKRAGTSSSAADRLIVITPHVEGIKREFADAFGEWHQQHFGSPVTIDYRSYGGASEIVRYFRSEEEHYKRFGTYRIDLVWGGGDYLFDEQLKKPGYLEGVELPPAVMDKCYPQREFNGINLYDSSKPPQWFGAALSSFGIVYNRDVLKYLGAPEPARWSDLADARLGGWFISADPTRSSSSRQVYMIIVERAMLDAVARGQSEDAGWAEGMGLVRLICSNARYFTDASSAVPNVVSTGDAAAGMAIDFYGRAQVDAVGSQRLAYIEPPTATVINADPIALVKGAEHRELAVRFIEFVLSEQGQRLWNTRAGAPGGPRSTSLRRLPIMPSVYQDPLNFTDPVNPFDASFGFKASPQLMKTFPILGELIEVSCMNLLEELRATRAAIVKSPRRAELEKKLATFPFDQKEALARQAKFRDRSTTPLQQLEMKRQWQEEFREEYRRLREDAEQSSGR